MQNACNNEHASFIIVSASPLRQCFGLMRQLRGYVFVKQAYMIWNTCLVQGLVWHAAVQVQTAKFA